jgi:hypothetical protein
VEYSKVGEIVIACVIKVCQVTEKFIVDRPRRYVYRVSTKVDVHSTKRNGHTKKEMADFSAIKTFFKNEKLAYFTFHPKSLKPISADTPAATLYEALRELGFEIGFEIISVKQMSSNRRAPLEGGSKSINLPLFLVTLPRNLKSKNILKLIGFCCISIKVEAYKNQTGLTQCHNCQQFGHVWAN